MFLTKKISIAITALLVFQAFANVIPVTSKADGKSDKATRVPDVVLLEVKAGVTLQDDPHGNVGHRFKTNSLILDHDLSFLGVQSVKPVFPPGLAKKLSETGKTTNNLSRIYRMKLKPNTDVDAVIASLSSNPDISFVEPDFIAAPSSIPTSNAPIVIDDPEYANQWGLSQIDIENAWDVIPMALPQ